MGGEIRNADRGDIFLAVPPRETFIIHGRQLERLANGTITSGFTFVRAYWHGIGRQYALLRRPMSVITVFQLTCWGKSLTPGAVEGAIWLLAINLA